MTVRDTLRDLHNAKRSAAGLPLLTLNTTLNQGADRYAEIMANQNWFSHTRPSGLTWYQWWDGYYPESLDAPAEHIGETIDRGYNTTSSVFTAWWNSTGHRANIMERDFRKLGIGQAIADNGTMYWVAHFCS
jgi:uncharacterized protein YkwD